VGLSSGRARGLEHKGAQSSCENNMKGETAQITLTTLKSASPSEVHGSWCPFCSVMSDAAMCTLPQQPANSSCCQQRATSPRPQRRPRRERTSRPQAPQKRPAAAMRRMQQMGTSRWARMHPLQVSCSRSPLPLVCFVRSASKLTKNCCCNCLHAGQGPIFSAGSHRAALSPIFHRPEGDSLGASPA